MKTPKLAICFFGLPRALDKTAPAILENLIGPLAQRGDLQCFAHLFSSSAQQGESVLAKADDLLPLTGCQYETPGDCQALGQSKDLLQFGDYWDNGGVSLRNLILQLHSLQRVTEMAQQAGAEHCFFARPDLLYHDSLAPQLDRLLSTARDQVFLPDWQHWKGGLNDRMAFCSGAGAMRAYGMRAGMALQFCRSTQSPLQSEQLVAYALWCKAIPWATLQMRATRVRADGQHMAEDFGRHGLRRARQKTRLRARWLRRGIWPGGQA